LFPSSFGGILFLAESTMASKIARMLSDPFTRNLLLAGWCLCLCGCDVPPVPPPGIAQIAPETLGLDPAPAPAAVTDWWTLFRDPQADALAAEMMKSNPSLQVAMARIGAARAELASADAGRSPQINLDGQIQEVLLSDEYVLPSPYGGSWRQVGDIQAKLTWSLDFWGRQAALIAKARSMIGARSLDAMAARLALAGAFAQAYIALLTAWRDIDIARETVTERQSILALTQSRADSGLENEVALDQAKALVAAAEVDVMALEADRDRAIHALAALTGQGAAAYGRFTRPVAALDAMLPLPGALPADLLSRRPDVQAARARIDVALHGREVAHADFYPNIDLTAALGFQAVGLGSLFSGSAVTTGVGPAIHLPLFDAGRLRAQYALAGTELDIAVGEYNGAVLESVRQAADALTDVCSLAARRVRQQAVLDSARHALQLAEERYRLGLSDQIVVLSAENLVSQARRQMAGLEAQLATQRVTLFLAVGGSVDTAALQENRGGPLHDQ
jgi:NodT family efflux transporter outer membrane factor (OMF) lipoprotein